MQSTSNTIPTLSVILPSYNAIFFLENSITSILNQTFSDFELILIDNASSDGSDQLLRHFKDPRIRLIINESNIGYTRSLNKGLALARGRYVARMDADDFSLKTRFEKQIQFLESNPDYGIVGCSYHVIDAKGSLIGTQRMPKSDLEIRWKNLLLCPFCHPSVMIRKSILDTHQLTFDVTKEPAEDYDLWSKIIDHSLGYNLPEKLFHYRIHGNNESTLRAQEQERQIECISLQHIQHSFPSLLITPQMIHKLRPLLTFDQGQKKPLHPDMIRENLPLYLRLWKLFIKKYPKASKNKMIEEQTFKDLLILFHPSLRKTASIKVLLQLFFTFPRSFLSSAIHSFFQKNKRFSD